MKLEKRGGQTPPPTEDPADTPPAGGKKPVIVYILILFVVAFLLMLLSLLMHQHSNTVALGQQLNDSIAAIKEAQNAQERIAELEQELKEANTIAQQFADANETSRNQASHAQYILEQTQDAMDWFWHLDEAYILGDTARCQDILAELARMDGSEGLIYEYLTPQALERYEEIAASLNSSD